jgi:integral membrane protein (TIGR01906 family)
VNVSLVERLAPTVAAVATPCVIVGFAVLLFLNPIWVGFDQDRSDVSGLTGYTPNQVRQVTGSILSDLVFGPPNFDVTLDGKPVLDASERSHMADVRKVLMSLGFVALLAAILLIVVGVASGGRRWFWRAAAAGARVLTVGVVVVGVAFALFFDQAFLLFHEIFFAPGTFMFDARTEKLVQLFPDQFWSETSVAIAGAVLGLSVLVWKVAERLGRDPSPASAPASPGTASS